MLRGIQVYRGKSFAEKSAILPVQVRKKVEFMVGRQEHFTISGASIILAELCGVLLGLRRSEFLATAERKPNMITLLCFGNLAGRSWDLADCWRRWDIVGWAEKLSLQEVVRIRLCSAKHQRHRVAHEVLAVPGCRHMPVIL